MSGLLRLIAKLFRELSDEAAYKRYLETRGTVNSRAEWRRFSEERLARKYSQAKCC